MGRIADLLGWLLVTGLLVTGWSGYVGRLGQAAGWELEPAGAVSIAVRLLALFAAVSLVWLVEIGWQVDRDPVWADRLAAGLAWFLATVGWLALFGNGWLLVKGL